MRQSFVYIIEAENGTAKIGVSRHPRNRLLTVRTHSPVCVRLISVWLGSQKDEQAIHKQFEMFHSHNEWFRIDGAMRDFVEFRRGVGVDAVDEWDYVRRIGTHSPSIRTRMLKSIAMKAAWARAKENPRLHGLRCAKPRDDLAGKAA